MAEKSTDTIPTRILIARFLIRLWPFYRGRGRLAQLFLNKFDHWPERARASFRFRFGYFVDAPIASWPKGYKDVFLYGAYEMEEVAMWKRVLKPGATVVDGGANWGYWTLVASKIVGKFGQVHAFEPVPDTCEALRKNVQRSQANNVIVHQKALADQEGSMAINLSDDDPIGGQSSIGTPTDRQVTEIIECEQVTLDEVFQDKPLQLIKLDIEGGELAALKGSMNILQRSEKPIITFEWNRMTAGAVGYQPEAIQDFLGSFGYRLFLATKNGWQPFKEPIVPYQWIPMVWALTELHEHGLQ